MRLSILLAFLLFATALHAEPPADRLAVLRRGVSVTHWFRFPPNGSDTAVRGYLTDAAIAELRKDGFTFVRLPVQPEYLREDNARRDLLIQVISRLHRHDLGVVIDLHPANWHLETNEQDRAALLAFWRWLAPALRPLDPRLTFPELLNEPVFPGAPQVWQELQHRVLESLRASLPDHTFILTGNDWSSVAGLEALRPEADSNVVYSFHLYEPSELTSLAAYRPGLDRRTLAQLPFPADDRSACFQVADHASDAQTASLVRFYCGLRWNAARVSARIDAAAKWAERNHAAVIVGEFGASIELNPAARMNWIHTVVEACEARRIGWALWGYDDIMGFAVQSVRSSSVTPMHPALLQALGLPPE
ncbi:MAG: cellulase family glycosylhydrolase [Acetobacteraceae bacterium]|nr:cellulase family glycosylhydrolase [Acetobacteraceae bacterium]